MFVEEIAIQDSALFTQALIYPFLVCLTILGGTFFCVYLVAAKLYQKHIKNHKIWNDYDYTGHDFALACAMSVLLAGLLVFLLLYWFSLRDPTFSTSSLVVLGCIAWSIFWVFWSLNAAWREWRIET